MAARRRRRSPRRGLPGLVGAGLAAGAALCGAAGWLAGTRGAEASGSAFSASGGRTGATLLATPAVGAAQASVLDWRKQRRRSSSASAMQAAPGAMDPAQLFRQLLSGELEMPASAAPIGYGANMAGNPAADPLAQMLASMGGMGGAGGAGAPPKPDSDAFITDRVPVLQRVKKFVLPAFFAFCLWKGWIGRWGFVFSLTSKSYLDALAIPVRMHPLSPFVGRPYVVAQFYVDTGFKVLKYIIDVVRGKEKFPPDFSKMMPMPQAQTGGGSPFDIPMRGAAPGGGSPFDIPMRGAAPGAAGAASSFADFFGSAGAAPSSAGAAAAASSFADLFGSGGFGGGGAPGATTVMPLPPTARTVAPPPPSSRSSAPVVDADVAPPRKNKTPPPVVDADVRFLD